ncbi:CxxxxCH/CxxCH domain c-type cytochrome [Geothermobacter hydrogeniphilus]|uniref:Cytochrome c domain-containing protein n=1 Tax=Geothermobacter hydrogeniphilus TaxID=1969733 RepID=A0A1X0Y3C7_9BACT|nr:CxxxxCH/CxxCH domain-containing protein [Geothermobacter hydrogeniphilus]ORJ59572.1 hypothetical protein B5V00_09820 [Geothermobacter hydrogeniphilus]
MDVQMMRQRPFFNVSCEQVCRLLIGGLLFLVLAIPSVAFATPQSSADTWLLTPGNRSITLSLGYTGDDNGDNQVLIAWIEEGGDWSTPLGSVQLAHHASPYGYTITGLSNDLSYRVRVTLSDPDNADIVQTYTGLAPYNPLIHSSRSTGSSRWSAAGGWGVKGGKYGRYTCETCHSRQTVNIKMIREDLRVNDPDSTDQLPIEAAGMQVSFSSTVNGSADFGDDSRADGSSSNRICEGCHTLTDVHRFDLSGQPGGTDHHNREDCIGCHQHSNAFKPGCTGCHDIPPQWNSHPAHAGSTTVMEPLACSACHKTSVHNNGLSEVRFDPGDSRLDGAVYDDGDETSRFSEQNGYQTTPAYSSCDNLSCHSNASPFDGVTVYRNPVWGGSAQNCSSCHDGGGQGTTLSGRHGRHTGTPYDFQCALCHAATAQTDSSIADPAKHLNGSKDVVFAASVGGSYNTSGRGCDLTYCHSDGRGGPPNRDVAWSDSQPTTCSDCHNGRIGDAVEMQSNAHDRLASSNWIRQYPCEYCHANTVDASGQIRDLGRHVNFSKDVVFDSRWAIDGLQSPDYDSQSKVCSNIYCHSDGTTVNPEVRNFAWDLGKHADCNTCHGHPDGECSACHSDGRTAFPPEEQWKSAMPMYANGGPGTARANSHLRHLQTNFSCENCHANTVVGSCQTAGCHDGGIPQGSMTEVGHVNASFHVNKVKDVVFKDGGSYDPATKRCSNTACHTGSDPQWGDSRDNEVLCFTCHGTTLADVDDFGSFNGIRARINMDEWVTSGHGRPAASGPYPSGNAAADFPGNPCWYCHDQDVLHKTPDNPFRLKLHQQFGKRFEKECVYCHMEGTDNECLGCHNDANSLAPQLATITSPPFSQDHAGFTDGSTSCVTSLCHPDDASRHKTGAGLWTPQQKADVRSQYIMNGVCLQCHDDDSNNRCNECHTWNGDPTQNPYRIGYDPGTGFIAGSSKAGSTHFGHKHYDKYTSEGVWGGGKFCWDCHDPHGDKNLYMIQNKVATTTDGVYGIPQTRAEVSFTRTLSGKDFARSLPPFNGICNVCHDSTAHYQKDFGDDHNSGRPCTNCHEHSFRDNHASGQACNSCHLNKPEIAHTAFSQSRDCTKCHDGVINGRMDVMRQFNGQSHHVQGRPISNRDCYACHWEATPEGLINRDHHSGYNNKTYTSISNAPVDLVIWGPGTRPTDYQDGVTAVQFSATAIGTVDERQEIGKVSLHCLGCHSDQNNLTEPFGDCKTPRQYAWDGTSIAARYLQTGTTLWGKYSGPGLADKQLTKAFSAHGNAVANQGGWDPATGEDEALPNTRDGSQNIQCFDCHSSHGSYTTGITSSYVTFDGSHGGANLKETQAGKGGYSVTYRAQAESNALSQLNPGASQCFDCHETRTAGEKPWGFESTFGASEPIRGYRDSSRFDGGDNGVKGRWAFMAGKTGISGHFSKLSPPLDNPAGRQVNGLCAACHDPHGVSPTLGSDQQYGVPLLKGTWLTDPYKEDHPQTDVRPRSAQPQLTSSHVQIDRKAFGDLTNRTHISESPQQFAGLCLGCHPQQNLTAGMDKSQPFGSRDRVHQAVKGWGSNAEHSFPCAKCHQPHSSGLPRLMRTNCLDWKHRGELESGGVEPGWYDEQSHFPRLRYRYQPCHQSPGAKGGTETYSNYKDQQWNQVTPW